METTPVSNPPGLPTSGPKGRAPAPAAGPAPIPRMAWAWLGRLGRVGLACRWQGGAQPDLSGGTGWRNRHPVRGLLRPPCLSDLLFLTKLCATTCQGRAWAPSAAVLAGSSCLDAQSSSVPPPLAFTTASMFAFILPRVRWIRPVGRLRAVWAMRPW